MTNRMSNPLFLGLLTMALLAAPTAAAGDEAGPDEGADQGPCEPIELMTFAPYVVFHPECIEEIVPSSSRQS